MRDYEEVLADILEQWENARESGKHPTVESLCGEHPHLAGEVRQRIKLLEIAERHLRPSTERPEAPEQIGEFEVREELGRGGMGVVYRCYQRSLQRDVAVKLIRPDLISPQLELQLKAESRILARLSHPHVARVFDLDIHRGLDGEQPYLVMEYVAGERVDHYVRDKRFTPEQCVDLVARISTILGYAHQKGIAHCDIKPSNILIDSTSLPKILDFGIAHSMARNGTVRFATYSYASPEQLNATGDVDSRTDIYSLALVCHDLVTGESRADQWVASQSARLSLVESSIPRKEDLEAILLKATHPDPDERFQTAFEFAADLRKYLARQLPDARPVRRVHYLARWSRNNLVLSALTLVLCACLMVGAVYAAVQARSASRWANRLVRAMERVDHQGQRLSQQETLLSDQAKNAQQQLVNARIRRAWDTAAVDPVRAFEWLHDEASIPREFRNFAWGLARDQCDVLEWQLPVTKNTVKAIAVSSTGLIAVLDHAMLRVYRLGARDTLPIMRVARKKGGGFLRFSPSEKYLIASQDSGPAIWDVADWTAWKIPVGECLTAVVSRDDRRVAVVEDDQISVWDLAEQMPLRSTSVPVKSVREVQFSRDGSQVWWVDSAGSVGRFSLGNGNVSSTDLQSVRRGGSIALHPMISVIAVASGNNPVRVVSAEHGGRTVRLHFGGKAIRALSFSDDGKTLALVSGARVGLWSTERWTRKVVLRAEATPFTSLSVSADGRRLAVSGNDAVRVWQLSTNPPGTVIPTAARIRVAVFTPDGDKLILGDETGGIELYDVPSLRPISKLQGHGLGVTGIAVAASGERMVTGGQDKTTIVWDLATGATVSRFDHQRKVSGVAFGALPVSADGDVHVFSDDETRQAMALNVRKIHALPDGGFVLGTYDGFVVRVDPDWNTVWSRQHGTQRVSSLAVNGESRRVVATTGSGAVVVRLDDGRVVSELRGHVERVFDGDISSDGRIVATTGRDGQVMLWDATTGQMLANVTFDGPLFSVCFGPRDRSLVIVRSTGQARVIRLRDADSLIENHAEIDGPE